ncbi:MULTISPECIES: hypothetical protein [unclassified Beijerinckia]|uniref:hypothetical protein n=1 Tax=unclassified Beijerinckia TaxID=2638183 RepID=UPI00089420D1|nr:MULTISPECIES: hypothetical protein [unclassified Beijerinckia]MDH7794010.1 hypothetical protein [Beijerinckia sp. GAS462]SEB51309.1 hypothetical protein SAMN05443249_0276 [Beijerinckia sp. 28-YEA-48]
MDFAVSPGIGAGAFRQATLFLAQSFIAIHQASPRIAALFATQQRWLLCHAGLAYHFRAVQAGQPGLTRRDMGQLALQHGIASRNTAYAFFDEALKYDVIRPAGGVDDGRTGHVVPAPAILSMLVHWYGVHFQTLDLMDGGARSAQFLSRSDSLLVTIEPLVAQALLSSPEVRMPGPLYTIFTWADVGGLLMDRLIAGIDWQTQADQDRILTDVSTISLLAQSFGLSRAHASRKLAAAESIGGLGWSGRRGRSCIWISPAFYEEYASAQKRKLLILDRAFSEACDSRRATR